MIIIIAAIYQSIIEFMEMTRPFPMILGYSIALRFLCPLCSGMDLSQE
jgi:hypothetical protein